MKRSLHLPVSSQLLLLVLSEGMCLYACFIVGVFMAPLYEGAEIYLTYSGGFWQIGLVVATVMAGLYLQDQYGSLRTCRTVIPFFNCLCTALGGAFLLQAVLGYAKLNSLVPRWVMILGGGLSLIVAPTWRKGLYWLVKNSIPERRLIFLGMTPIAAELLKRLADGPTLGTTVVGYIDDEERPEYAVRSPFLGCASDFRRILAEYRPDTVLIAGGGVQLRPKDLLDLRSARVELQEVADAYEKMLQRVPVRDLNPSEILFSPDRTQAWSMLLWQNTYSFGIAVGGLILASPLMVLVAFLIRITSTGPVLFRQTRVGLEGKTFTLFKFRSMWANAERTTGPVWAQKDDPRIMPVGRWLRRTRIDELPQLFNVLRGEMCIVGPRPERPEFVSVLSEKIPCYNQRHVVKPGITADQPPLRRHGGGHDHEARIRSILHSERNASLRCLDHLPHFEGHSFDAGESMIRRSQIICPARI